MSTIQWVQYITVSNTLLCPAIHNLRHGTSLKGAKMSKIQWVQQIAVCSTVSTIAYYMHLINFLVTYLVVSCCTWCSPFFSAIIPADFPSISYSFQVKLDCSKTGIGVSRCQLALAVSCCAWLRLVLKHQEIIEIHFVLGN